MRTLLLPLVLLAATLLGCGGLLSANEPAEPAPAPAEPAPAQAAPAPAPLTAVPPAAAAPYPMSADVPGFESLGPWRGEGPAPIYVTLGLNINDFLRPREEAAAIRRYLEAADRLGLAPIELSFAEHIVEELAERDPDLIADIKAKKHTIMEHHRVLNVWKAEDVAHELYRTDPETRQLQRDRPGPFVLLQQTFGVTPRSSSTPLALLFKRQWVEGERTRQLKAAGVSPVGRGETILPPERLVAAGLDPFKGGEERSIEAQLAIRELQSRIGNGERLAPGELRERYTDLVRMAYVVRTQGFDLSAVDGLSRFMDVGAVPALEAGLHDVEPSGPQRDRVLAQIQSDREQAAADMESVLAQLAARMAVWTDLSQEIRAKLARLDPGQAYVARFTCHATDLYTADKWMENITLRKGLIPAPNRPKREQDAIAAVLESILAVFAENPRVQVISLENDSQWDPRNAPGRAWQDLFGVSLAQLPRGVTPEDLEAALRREGLEVPESGRGAEGGKAGKTGKTGKSGGKGGKGGGGNAEGEGSKGEGGGGKGGGSKGGGKQKGGDQ